MNPSLLLIPDRYKAAKLYSQIPDSGAGDLTFARNSSATRVNSAGLIEKVRTNLYPNGSALLSTGWSSVGATLTAGQTDPNGGTTALRVQFTAGSGNYIFQAFTGSAATYARSAFIKAATAQTIRFADPYTGAGGTINLTTSYQRFTAIGAGIAPNFGIQFDNGSDDGAKDFTIAFVQIEEGDIATDYIPTTTAAVSVGITADIPRLDYTGGGCPSLLLEPQRTNLTAQSEDFNGWGSKVNVTTTANYAVSPDGYTNADRLQFTGNGFLYGVTGFNQTSGTIYTLSCYAKRNGSGTQGIGFFVDGSGGINSAWTLTSNWQRFTYTYTAGNTSTVGIAAASGADVSVYGFQFEVGSYATSYIPTLGSSVTRLADDASKTGISSLIGQTAGTLYLEFNATGLVPTNARINLSDETNVNWVFISIESNKLRGFVRANGVTIFSDETISPTANNKVAIAYQSGSIALYINGVQILTDASAFAFSSPLIQFGTNLGASNQVSDAIVVQAAAIYTTRLSNSELASLTSL